MTCALARLAVSACMCAGAAAVAIVGGQASSPLRRTRGGELGGVTWGSVDAWLNIPFAAPPVGKLRWAPPAQATPWSGTRDASKWGPRCVQDDGDGAEDCLQLNVFAPTATEPGAKLPVLLWIHGGGYEGGSASGLNVSSLVAFLSSSDGPGAAIVVATNYRLNIYGFLGHDALRSRDTKRGSTGNYGIQDQRAAMAWVRDNIAPFGGDAQRVMIFGQSAGAGSVTNHLSMPASDGLFSAAICESGAFVGWDTQPMNVSSTVYEQVVSASGCGGGTAASAVACLSALNASALSAAVLTIPIGYCCSHTAGYPWITWSPTVDGVELTAHPIQLLAQGAISRVPIVVGTTLDDGAPFEPLDKQATASELQDKFAEWYSPTMGSAKSVANALTRLYVSNIEYPNASTYNATPSWWAAQRSLTDQSFACGARAAAHALGARGPALPLFQYHWSHTHGSVVVPHGSELEYVFMETAGGTAGEIALAKTTATFWYNMAAHGNVNGDAAAAEGASRWPAFEPANDGPYLEVNVASAGGLQLRTGFRAEACRFIGDWVNISVNSEIHPKFMN